MCSPGVFGSPSLRFSLVGLVGFPSLFFQSRNLCLLLAGLGGVLRGRSGDCQAYSGMRERVEAAVSKSRSCALHTSVKAAAPRGLWSFWATAALWLVLLATFFLGFFVWVVVQQLLTVDIPSTTKHPAKLLFLHCMLQHLIALVSLPLDPTMGWGCSSYLTLLLSFPLIFLQIRIPLSWRSLLYPTSHSHISFPLLIFYAFPLYFLRPPFLLFSPLPLYAFLFH